LLILVPFGPRLGWRRGNLSSAVRVLAPGLAAAVFAGAVALAFGAPHSLTAAAAVALGIWVIAASILDLRAKSKAHALSLHSFASTLAHAGLGIALLGIAGTICWKSEALDVLSPGQSVQVGGYDLEFAGVTSVAGPNYMANRGDIIVRRDGSEIARLAPEMRLYPVEGQSVSKTAIRTNGFSNLYVALGDNRGGGRWLIRAFVHPLAPLMWFGGGLMALGGFAGLLSRIRLPLSRWVLAPAE
jgi:cytochrome c-type biogenesis protein CcmF